MSVLGMLKRRNLKVFSANSYERLIFPLNFPEASRERLYRLLHHYGFRLFLKDLLLHGQSFALTNLTRYCSEEAARGYLQELLALELVEPKGADGFRLKRAEQVFSLGETLEWYLARLLQNELECEALWNVVLSGIPSGGDFDVLAQCENYLVYLEVKSAPPKSIELENVQAFLRRVRDLRPQSAIFFEDTTLRMKDKIVPHFEACLASHFAASSPSPPKFERLKNETFHWNSIYLTNAKPGILESLQICLSHFLRGQGLSLGDSPSLI